MSVEFNSFPKIPRLSKEMIITEKLDGTNGCIYIGEDHNLDIEFRVGSRNRWITPDDDNYGFARWAYEHRDELIQGLGIGCHYGEWWGQGIQRNYGLTEKRFSLFNVRRWCLYNETPQYIIVGDPRISKPQQILPECCGLVPLLLHKNDFDTNLVDLVLRQLKERGSQAAPGFMKPEGVVVYHTAGSVLFKKTIEGDKGKFS